jgi:beta-1,2-mannosidase
VELARNYQDATAFKKIHVSQDYFSARYKEESTWAIGPFTRDESLTFTAREQWADPTNTDWTASSIFNPSLIFHDGQLVLFYRASPGMESTASRIGMAVHVPGTGWTDSRENPVIYPTQDNELYGCEDPKIYQNDGRFFLFYNGVFPIDRDDATAYPSPKFQIENLGCDINLAISDDLRSWTKLGPIVPHQVSRLWCKGAVIPRDPNGNAVRIGGEFLMYLSEGCNGTLQIGRSDDLVHWTFEESAYLDLRRLDGELHEVACAAAAFDDQGHIMLDLFYGEDGGISSSAQALYHEDEPFTQIALNKGGTLAWGGLLRHRGTWLFAQGWDAGEGIRELYFYRSH